MYLITVSRDAECWIISNSFIVILVWFTLIFPSSLLLHIIIITNYIYTIGNGKWIVTKHTVLILIIDKSNMRTMRHENIRSMNNFEHIITSDETSELIIVICRWSLIAPLSLWYFRFFPIWCDFVIWNLKCSLFIICMWKWLRAALHEPNRRYH